MWPDTRREGGSLSERERRPSCSSPCLSSRGSWMLGLAVADFTVFWIFVFLKCFLLLPLSLLLKLGPVAPLRWVRLEDRLSWRSSPCECCPGLPCARLSSLAQSQPSLLRVSLLWGCRAGLCGKHLFGCVLRISLEGAGKKVVPISHMSFLYHELFPDDPHWCDFSLWNISYLKG